MTRFCGNCGSQLADTDMVCPKCGMAAQAGMQQAAQGQDPNTYNASANYASAYNTQAYGTQMQYAQAGASKTGGMNKKFIIIGASALAAVVVLVLVLVLVLSGGGYKGTIDKLLKAMQNEDAEAFVSLFSKAYMDYEEYFGRDEDDVIRSVEYEISYAIDYLEDKVGNLKSISFKVESEKPFTDRKLKNFKDEYEEYYDIDMSGITEVMELKLELTVKGSEDTMEEPMDGLILVKENGSWKIWNDDIYY